MRALTGMYKGDRLIQLLEEVDLPPDAEVYILLPDPEDEIATRSEIKRIAEASFARLWSYSGDDVWNEYLSTA